MVSSTQVGFCFDHAGRPESRRANKRYHQHMMMNECGVVIGSNKLECCANTRGRMVGAVSTRCDQQGCIQAAIIRCRWRREGSSAFTTQEGRHGGFVPQEARLSRLHLSSRHTAWMVAIRWTATTRLAVLAEGEGERWFGSGWRWPLARWLPWRKAERPAFLVPVEI